MIKINIIKLEILIVLTILLITPVFAFGVASSNAPVTIFPGETKTTTLRLQNMLGTEDLTIKAKIINGSEIATLTKTEFLVKLGTKDTEVPIKITIPSDTPINSTYKVTVSLTTITPGQETGVALGTGIDKSITVLVVAETPEAATGTLTWVLIIATVIVIIIIATILIKRKETIKK